MKTYNVRIINSKVVPNTKFLTNDELGIKERFETAGELLALKLKYNSLAEEAGIALNYIREDN